MSTNLQRTSDAIERRDREVPALWERIFASDDQGEVERLIAEVNVIEESVGIAFGEDTKEFNNPKTCRECVRAGEPTPAPGERDVSFVRRRVRAWKAGE